MTAKAKSKKVRNPKTGRTRTVRYGQKGASVRPNSPKGDAYCARSYAQLKKHKKAASNPNSPLRLSRKRWKCKGKVSSG